MQRQDPDEAGSNGRHRRPQSLADSTRPRPVPFPSVERVRITTHRIDSERIATGDGYQDSRVTAVWAAAGLAEGHVAPPRARTPRTPRRTERPRGRKPGRHAMAAEPGPLATTVRAMPAIRDWALHTGDQPPVMGSHRAPGTLPIESWLLVGKRRQQMLLASLVAIGMIIVAIPIQQRQSGLDAVNAANHATAATKGRGTKNTGKPAIGAAQHQAPAAAAPGSKATAPPNAAKPGQQTPSNDTSTLAPTDSGATALAVPPGSGPAQSLRTTGSTTVALTFDDGPDPVETPKILALLAEYDVKATFCLVGRQVQKHPEIVAQIVAAGHTLCNHTWSHSLTLGKAKPAAIRADLERTNAAIRAAVPDARIPFFRAPGGNFTPRLVSLAYSDEMTSLYWQVDPRDWDHLVGETDTAHIDRVIAAVQKKTKPGSIILSHDFGQPDTITAYQELLPWITENFQVGPPVPPPIETPPATPPATPSAPAPAASEPPATPEQPAE